MRLAAAESRKNKKNCTVSRVWSKPCDARQLGAKAPSPPRAQRDSRNTPLPVWRMRLDVWDLTRDSFICDVTHLYVTWLILHIVTRLMHISRMRHDSCIYASASMNASFLCVTRTWFVHMTWAMSYMNESCHMRISHAHAGIIDHVRDMTHSYVRHDSFIRETRLIHMCDKTWWYGLAILVVSLKWLVSFAKETYERDEILQHMCDIHKVVL